MSIGIEEYTDANLSVKIGFSLCMNFLRFFFLYSCSQISIKILFAGAQDGLVSILAFLYACSVLEYTEVLGYTYQR